MLEKPFDNKQTQQEKLAVKIRLAAPDDWEACKELRNLEMSGNDKEMFGSTLRQRLQERLKSKEEWQKDLSRSDWFLLLSFVESKPVGMARAEEKSEGWWHVGWLYVIDDFKRKGIGKRLTAERLNEIRKRGGRKVSGFIKENNKQNMENSKFFGFKRVEVASTDYSEENKSIALNKGFAVMELDLTDPEVIKKIDQVLNAK